MCHSPALVDFLRKLELRHLLAQVHAEDKHLALLVGQHVNKIFAVFARNASAALSKKLFVQLAPHVELLFLRLADALYEVNLGVTVKSGAFQQRFAIVKAQSFGEEQEVSGAPDAANDGVDALVRGLVECVLRV